MYLIFIIAVTLLPSIHAGKNNSMNAFFDALIYNVKNTKELPLNALPLVNTTEDIDKSSWVHYLYNNFTLYNGTAYNLTTLDRYGDSFISYNARKIQIYAGLKFKRLEVTYMFEVTGHYSLFSQRALIRAIIEDFNIIANVSANTMTYEAHVDGSFPDPGRLTVKIEESSVLKYIINGILDIGTEWFERRILNAVKESVLKAINDMLMINNVF